MGKTVLMQGNEACVEGALAAGMRLYAGYPITPSTEIAELSALRLPQEGGKFIQMEDEIASIACAIGASVAGVKAMTATSGPGFSLKQENIGYACLAEIPMVIVDVQRCGPSTGMPTSPSQGDVMMARWGTHGDHPIIVISPSSVRETYTLAVRCFNLSEKYRTPVIFLMDEIIGHLREGMELPEPEELEGFLRSGEFDGLNVTIPYKKTVIPYCAELSDTARAIGAVNTIVRRPDGTLWGGNTDAYGFSMLVQSSGAEVRGKKALVFGSGGASATAQYVLRQMGAREVVVISRHGEDNYENLGRHTDAEIAVNATPLGMYPNTGVSPVDLSRFPKLEAALDVIYNPARTEFLLQAEQLGLKRANGLLMLTAQAKKSCEAFLGAPIADERIAAITKSLAAQMQNVVLIGMPGSGKTTIGTRLAAQLGRTFLDADTVLEQKAGMNIPEIFRLEGEDGFRQRETAVLAELGKRSGLVIATGGGCVTRLENYPLLHQNGTIFCLTRDLSRLPISGRPVSQALGAEELYRRRKPLYEKFADAMIDNDRTVENAVRQILEVLG